MSFMDLPPKAVLARDIDTLTAGKINTTGSATQVAISATIATGIEGSAGVSIEEFGAVGNDPTFDNKQALLDAMASGKPLIVPAKSYRVASTVRRSFSGVRITGLPGARIWSDIVAEVIRMDATDDAVFTGITFETTTTGAADNTNGIVYSLSSNIRNVTFDRCKFRSATNVINGLKFIMDNVPDEYALDNVYARNCQFIECGRMGLEVQDHTPSPTITRVRNVGAVDCIFRDCGKLMWGIDLSFSGPIVSASSIRNKFYNTISICAEFAGALVSPVATDNEFITTADACNVISITNSVNTLWTTNAVIERNRSLGRSGAGARLWNLLDARMANNTFLCKSYVHFRDCKRLVSVGDVYDSTGSYALYCESNNAAREATYGVWRNASLVNTTGGLSVARFSGSKCYLNRIEDSRIARSVGVKIDQLSSAYMNSVYRHTYNENPYTPGKTIDLTTDANRDFTSTPDTLDAEAIVFTSSVLTAQRLITFPASSRGWRIRNATTQPLNFWGGAGGGTVLAAGASMFYALDNVTPTVA